MDALLAAIAKALPSVIAENGALFVILILSIAGNVLQFRERLAAAARWEAKYEAKSDEVTAEIKASSAASDRWRETFEIATQAWINGRRGSRS